MTTLANTPNILKKIVARKQEEIAQAKKQCSYNDVLAKATQADTPRGFEKALANSKPGIIAEVKKASPSKGIISPNFDATATAKGYQQAGAACLSVLTDVDFFQGSDEYLLQAHSACSLPILRKDFMLEPYQIAQSRALHADCILLIVACLSNSQLQELHHASVELGMDVLIESHDQDELDRALQLPSGIIGINNRDLRTFTTDLNTTIKLKDQLPQDRLLVTESGIASADDIAFMQNKDVHHFLIGEHFMKTTNPGASLADTLNTAHALLNG